MRRIVAGVIMALVVVTGTASAKDNKTKKALRTACHALVASQNDPDINGRTAKLTKALMGLRRLGYAGDPDRTPPMLPPGPPEAAIGGLCKQRFPKDRVIQNHDFTTEVPLAPNSDGSPPSCCTTTTTTKGKSQS